MVQHNIFVREAGLEPARPRTPEPKSGAYANFATRANGTTVQTLPGLTGIAKHREGVAYWAVTLPGVITI
ncbi:hypothetical protein NS07_v2contig00023-0031 [Nocardia seriolae]|nr:hypothetical protein NS07_v2contig00023-0031 [Nocardia seriolae]